MKTIDTPINWKTRLGWTACAMPELLKNFVWDAFVLFFYAQVVGLNGVFIGAALLIVLLFDAFVNPFIGTFSDRLVGSPLGRRHTLMAWAIVPFAIGVLGIFSPPEDMPQLRFALTLISACAGRRCRVDVLSTGSPSPIPAVRRYQPIARTTQ